MENTFWDCFFLPSTEELLPPSLPFVAQNDQASASMSTEELLQPERNLEEQAFDSDVVPPSLLDIIPILRVANEVEPCNSRIAYLCRFYAFEQAHKLDPSSTGPGVRQFKTALLQRLERDNSPSCLARGTKSDAREMQSFYRHLYTTYIQSLQNSSDKADSAKLTKAYQTLGVLFEVLKAVNQTQSIETDHETEKLLPLSPPLVAKNDQASDSKSMEELLPPPPPLLPLPQRSLIGLEQPAGNHKEGAFEVVVPSSLFEIITPIFRVANEVEPINSRVAYLCRFYAFEKAHKLDPTSSERGVRQFKTALLQQLEREDSQSRFVRGTKSDAGEMQSFYRHFTTTYVPSLHNSADKADSAQLTKTNQTAGLLFEVLKFMKPTDWIETDSENLKSNVKELPVCDIEEKMMATDEKRQPPPPPVVAHTWDHYFPAEEVLNSPLSLDAENDQ